VARSTHCYYCILYPLHYTLVHHLAVANLVRLKEDLVEDLEDTHLEIVGVAGSSVVAVADIAEEGDQEEVEVAMAVMD